MNINYIVKRGETAPSTKTGAPYEVAVMLHIPDRVCVWYKISRRNLNLNLIRGTFAASDLKQPHCYLRKEGF